MSDLDCVDGICSPAGGVDGLETYLITHPELLVSIIIYVVYWYIGGWVLVFQYSQRIVENRPESLPPPRDTGLYERISDTSVAQLAADFPVTTMHFLCCYPVRVADTFSAAGLTSFWAGYCTIIRPYGKSLVVRRGP